MMKSRHSSWVDLHYMRPKKELQPLVKEFMYRCDNVAALLGMGCSAAQRDDEGLVDVAINNISKATDEVVKKNKRVKEWLDSSFLLQEFSVDHALSIDETESLSEEAVELFDDLATPSYDSQEELDSISSYRPFSRVPSSDTCRRAESNDTQHTEDQTLVDAGYVDQDSADDIKRLQVHPGSEASVSQNSFGLVKFDTDLASASREPRPEEIADLQEEAANVNRVKDIIANFEGRYTLHRESQYNMQQQSPFRTFSTAEVQIYGAPRHFPTRHDSDASGEQSRVIVPSPVLSPQLGRRGSTAYLEEIAAIPTFLPALKTPRNLVSASRYLAEVTSPKSPKRNAIELSSSTTKTDVSPAHALLGKLQKEISLWEKGAQWRTASAPEEVLETRKQSIMIAGLQHSTSSPSLSPPEIRSDNDLFLSDFATHDVQDSNYKQQFEDSWNVEVAPMANVSSDAGATSQQNTDKLKDFAEGNGFVSLAQDANNRPDESKNVLGLKNNDHENHSDNAHISVASGSGHFAQIASFPTGKGAMTPGRETVLYTLQKKRQSDSDSLFLPSSTHELARDPPWPDGFIPADFAGRGPKENSLSESVCHQISNSATPKTVCSVPQDEGLLLSHDQTLLHAQEEAATHSVVEPSSELRTKSSLSTLVNQSRAEPAGTELGGRQATCSSFQPSPRGRHRGFPSLNTDLPPRVPAVTASINSNSPAVDWRQSWSASQATGSQNRENLPPWSTAMVSSTVYNTHNQQTQQSQYDSSRYNVQKQGITGHKPTFSVQMPVYGSAPISQSTQSYSQFPNMQSVVGSAAHRSPAPRSQQVNWQPGSMRPQNHTTTQNSGMGYSPVSYGQAHQAVYTSIQQTQNGAYSRGFQSTPSSPSAPTAYSPFTTANWRVTSM